MELSINAGHRTVDYRQMQLTFAVLTGAYLLFLAVIVIYRSADRSSLLGAETALDAPSDQLEGVHAPVQRTSSLHLRDFHRSEIQDGRLAWEVKARDARYFADETLAQLSDAAITVHRTDGSSVTVKSRAGKMFISEMALQRAELEGNIEVVLDDSILIETELANFDSKSQEITAPGSVKVSGPGFVVTGIGMKVYIEPQLITLSRNVESQFEQGGKVPKFVESMKQKSAQ
ncbi:MAG: LPS export ABC transporter periplasmic protein LptC [Bdellovibrionales bacterium]|nr:LPS export ABC transporter periplasmic protein LptC [Bdellovibrionales bacterium]